MNAKIILKEKSSNGRYRYLIECLQCHRKKWTKESLVKAGYGKFCTIACSRKYRKEHSEEYKKKISRTKNSNKCKKCGIGLTTEHHGFYGICYTLHSKGSTMCYMCEIKYRIKNHEQALADKLIKEFRKRALKTLSEFKKDEIIKNIYGIKE